MSVAEQNEAFPVKLSVCVLAYNQASLFREAIQSVVTQQTDFNFEIIVCDDASTDGTADVLREYAAQYPDLIRPVFREKNVGHYVNYVEAHNLARGEYVAHLDGDDVFHPGKLQKQVDFLDQHAAVSVVWHAVELIDDQALNIGRICIRNAIAADGYVGLEDVLEIGTIGVHSATMYRSNARTTRSPDICPIDWYYAVEFLSHGKGYQLSESLGVYRKLEGTSMSSNTASAKRVRGHLANMIIYYIQVFPEHRRRLLTLSLLYLLCDIRAGSSSALFMLRPVIASLTLLSPVQFMAALKRFRAVSKAFRGQP